MNNHSHADAGAKLTRNQSLVLDTLTTSASPMSAYSILDKLREEGMRAPLQVYRALDKLVELGAVHRLESLNAFVACRHADCESHAFTAFTICESCNQVQEVADEKLARQIDEVSASRGFKPSKSTVELRGTCGKCLDKQSA